MHNPPNTGAVKATPIELLRPARSVSPMLLSRAWHRGELIRVIPGVYAESTRWRALPRWDRYLSRVHAVALRDPHVIFSGPSAAALHGVYLGRADERVHVLEPQGSSRRSDVLWVHTGRNERNIEELDGILLTSVHDTIVDVARQVPPVEGLAYADALLRVAPGLRVERLQAINETRASSRRRRHARWALERASGMPESVLESLSLGVMELAGFELPQLQVTFHIEGHEDRADFYWPGLGLIGEADGRVKYGDAGSDAAEAIMKEKRRESRLRRNCAGLIRWGWTEIRPPSLLTRMLVRAGVPRPRLNDAAMLATLRDLA